MLTRRAEAGDIKAQLELGLRYGYGRGVKQDLTISAQWTQKAADQGNPEAQFELGDAYLKGYGIQKDLQKACEWFQKAADQGNGDAQSALGQMFTDGRGVQRDPVQGTKLYKKSAEQGNRFGQGNFGVALIEGIGTSRNVAEGTAWLRKASANGSAWAKERLDYYAKRGAFMARYANAAKGLNVVDQTILKITADWSSRLISIAGGRYRINEGTEGSDIFAGIFSALPQSDYQKHFETGIQLHKWIMGLDGSTTSQAMAKLSTLVGKYYVLKGDAYQIVTDRDYPREGKHSFNMFGGEVYVGNTTSYVTFACHSKAKVPPYRIAPAIVRFTGFHFGQNRAGKTVIIPEVQIVWMYMGIH